MNEENIKHTELQKLLHILQAEGSVELQFLSKLTKDELQLLRLKITAVLQFTQTDIWKRLTGVSKYLPNYMSAKISETVMGPLITANMSYYMPVKDAIAIMKHMSISFLSSVSEFMVPENAKELINQIPIDLLKKVTTELMLKKKYMTAAGFVDVSDISRLIELSKVINKEEDLIHIASYVENKIYIAKIVERFSDERIQKIITTAYQYNLQQEVIEVFVHLSPSETQRTLKIISILPVHFKTQVLKDFENRIQIT